MLNFAGVSIPNFVKVKAVYVSALPSINTNLKGSTTGFGVINGKTSFGETYLKADVSIIIPSGYSIQKCARELAVWLRGNNFDLSPLIVQDDAEIRYMAKASSSVDISDLIFAGKGTLEFVVPSGCSESVTEKSETGTPTATVTYLGSCVAYPTIEVTVGAPTSVIVINHIQKGDSIYLNGTFNTGDKILIDCNKHLVKLNNKLHMELIGITSDFIGLESGENGISCSISGSNVKVTYRERFL